MIIRHIDAATCISDTLESYGSNSAQIDDAILVLGPKCRKLDDYVVYEFDDKSTARIDGPEFKKWLDANKDYLLPRKFEESLASKAFLGKGNATAMQKLAREVGLDQCHKIAQSYGRRNAFDDRTIGVAPKDDSDDGGSAVKKADPKKNPWADTSSAGEARRVSCLKSLPTKVCTEFARAAGVDLAGRPLRRAS
jgi:hypothetical protein